MTTPRIAIVGCGFVGSIFTSEFLRLMFAGKLPQALRFIDDDVVEERNCANQNFLITDSGKPKAQVMALLADRFGQEAEWEQTRLTDENIDQLLEGAILIVDGVDNLATRQLLWGYAIRTGIPVLHIGIAVEGTGAVEWTHPEHDTFALAPDKTYGREIKDPTSGVTPPCELVRMRGVGLTTSYAAALAAAIYLGFDATAALPKERKTAGYLTEWGGTPERFFPIRETWSRIQKVTTGVALADAAEDAETAEAVADAPTHG